jgi:hypothetical protein
MEKYTHKSEKSVDKHQPGTGNEKPEYETPVVMPLGGLSTGWGGPHCKPGGTAVGQCQIGDSAAGGKCQTGTAAGGGKCDNGSTASGDTCQLGGNAAGCSSGSTVGPS